MLDLLPPRWDAALSRLFSPVSRWLSRTAGGEDMPISAQVDEPWRTIIGRKHCARSRKAWGT